MNYKIQLLAGEGIAVFGGFLPVISLSPLTLFGGGFLFFAGVITTICSAFNEVE
jgi:hypothetical protein